MSTFDLLIADIKCPETGKKEQAELQIFFREGWRDNVYHIGDALDNLADGYNNTWVRTDYVCRTCSPKTKGRYGDFIKVDDQRRHYCFIHVENRSVVEVIAEEEFNTRGIDSYINDR